MQFPFRIIESSMTNRYQFDMVDGYQPTHAFFYLKKGGNKMNAIIEIKNLCKDFIVDSAVT